MESRVAEFWGAPDLSVQIGGGASERREAAAPKDDMDWAFGLSTPELRLFTTGLKQRLTPGPAATLGAPPLAIARRITLPLVASGLVVGFITGFLQSFEELTIAMFVGGGLVTTLPKQMWDDILFQVNPTLAAASVVVTVIVALLFLAMELMQGRVRR